MHSIHAQYTCTVYICTCTVYMHSIHAHYTCTVYMHSIHALVNLMINDVAMKDICRNTSFGKKTQTICTQTNYKTQSTSTRLELTFWTVSKKPCGIIKPWHGDWDSCHEPD